MVVGGQVAWHAESFQLACSRSNAKVVWKLNCFATLAFDCINIPGCRQLAEKLSVPERRRSGRGKKGGEEEADVIGENLTRERRGESGAWGDEGRVFKVSNLRYQWNFCTVSRI